jgi:hypothetical protein
MIPPLALAFVLGALTLPRSRHVMLPAIASDSQPSETLAPAQPLARALTTTFLVVFSRTMHISPIALKLEIISVSTLICHSQSALPLVEYSSLLAPPMLPHATSTFALNLTLSSTVL